LKKIWFLVVLLIIRYEYILRIFVKFPRLYQAYCIEEYRFVHCLNHFAAISFENELLNCIFFLKIDQIVKNGKITDLEEPF